MSNNWKWNLKLVATSLNLRIEKGHNASDYSLSGEVAKTQLRFSPDIICNYEDMEGCFCDRYNELLDADYIRIAATDDQQRRGVSCWVKRCYSAEKVYSMSYPHFMHVRITTGDGVEVNSLILRILVSDSGIADFKDRYVQLRKALHYIDSLKEKKNFLFVGDWNHGVIGEISSYLGKPRQYYNYQMIEKLLADRRIEMVSLPGYSYKGYMAIDHLAVSSGVTVENARYEDVFGTDVSEIGRPDHSYIVAELRIS